MWIHDTFSNHIHIVTGPFRVVESLRYIYHFTCEACRWRAYFFKSIWLWAADKFNLMASWEQSLIVTSVFTLFIIFIRVLLWHIYFEKVLTWSSSNTHGNRHTRICTNNIKTKKTIIPANCIPTCISGPKEASADFLIITTIHIKENWASERCDLLARCFLLSLFVLFFFFISKLWREWTPL